MSENATPLSDDDSDYFHHMVAKLLYLCKRVRPDIHTAVAVLTTRVAKPTIEDYKKLGHCIGYLREYPHLPLTLEVSANGVLEWWVDASFAVHPDMKSHTGAVFTMGKGAAYTMSTKQKINTESSTEAELVGVDDALPNVLWIRRFLTAQGFTVNDNIVYQDNQSAILLERNGQRSSGKRTRHIDIRYYFITDRILNKEVRVEYCPTGEMTSDTLTKPLQGTKFREYRQQMLNLPIDTCHSPRQRNQLINSGLDVVDNNTEYVPQECVETHADKNRHAKYYGPSSDQQVSSKQYIKIRAE